MPSTPSRTTLTRELHLASLVHRLERQRRTWEARSTLGTAELRLLWLLTEGEPRTLREIAERLHLEQSTVNRQVNAAVKAGHVRKSRAPGSAFLFEPTPAGRAQLEEDTAYALGQFRVVLDRLGPDDAAHLLELLGRFVDLYGEAVDETETGRP
ncbi:MarR family winged helix-turn-helix transcriptional regulator [Cellulomonas sp. DKR-3]|uniref:MarR family winged helix-turn-helix transcriptional regulator n=1 Tax=Cellulomonas fulva TaxID=2835530 RepID=A0ABS5TWT7_9CELL|nr:MarR family winged helix-turn-helix transcriptional regulator [Cellulomonas fulva]MBT0993562.1 MarR family winged helix-turn-helix transcriptional regulator [Cellulomonas fulva]